MENNKLNLLDLINTSPTFERALVYADKLTTDELFEKFDKLDYPAYGFPMIMVYKSSGENALHPEWRASLRNPKDWKEPSLDCKGNTIHEAIKLMYAWCIYKEYLPKEASVSTNLDDLPLELDQTWDTFSVLKELIEATDILLLEKDHDGHGWELKEKASARGKEILLQIQKTVQSKSNNGTID